MREITVRVVIARCVAAALVLALARETEAARIVVSGTKIAVMPLASETIGEKEIHQVASAMDRALEAAGYLVVRGGDVSAALREIGCSESSSWNRESCIRSVARELRAGLVLGGRANVIGSLYEAAVTLYDAETGVGVWSATYQIKGGIEDFYLQLPAKVVADLPKEAEQPDLGPLPRLPPIEKTTEATEQAVPSVGRTEESDCGISPGLAFGVSGIFALGEPIEWQTPYSVRAHAVYPTGRNGQARVKAGIPLAHNHKLELSSRKKYPDLYLGAEHEWGWPGFAVGVGLGYSYMQYFQLEGTDGPWYGDRLYDAYFEPAHSLNMCVNLRAGRPHAGFFGRLSWPLPYIFQDHEPDNFLLEGSAMAAFGAPRVKGGIGIVGMYKRREADYVKYRDTTYYYRDSGVESRYHEFTLNTAHEFMLLVPCARLAMLLAGHVVLNLTLELGGTILPRSPFSLDEAEYWKPSVGLDIVYSLGKLKGASVLDGTF